MKKNILIVHYNTPYLTECLVRSINLFMKDAVIYIFDNSNEKPFTAKFDNVTVFDNTKGQIIDFNKWLNSIKTKDVSKNNYASAKHCYSVQKCMSLINDNFILLDSDVLLKKDLSELYDEKYIYIGDIEKYKGKERVIPYCCFINVKKCEENKINYFNKDFIIGLTHNSTYDTGANFYLECKKLTSKKIKYRDYIVHMDNGSLLHKKNQKAQEFFLSRNKNLYCKSENKMVNTENKSELLKSGTTNNKYVVYTCITGGYDSLKDPEFISDGFDYVCFTDSTSFKSYIWDIRPLPKETEGLSQVKKQRYVKINPHKLLGEYEVSIWVDGNMKLRGDLNKFMKETIKEDCSVYVPKHPVRDCIYDEESAVVRMRKDKSEITKPQMDRYKEDGFPKKYGLLQSNILLRKHNNEDCIKLMECWFEELKNGSHRDQLSFNYASWKNQDVKVIYMDKGICKSEYFFWSGTHVKARPTISVKPTPNPTTTQASNPKADKQTTHNALAYKEKKLSSALDRLRQINRTEKKYGRIAYMNKMTTNNIGIY